MYESIGYDGTKSLTGRLRRILEWQKNHGSPLERAMVTRIGILYRNDEVKK